ncbi:putative Carboxypeptidase Y [Seiridium cardinale]|uniref:Carboxypeptidase Y n=1 Tax=Seiridium cardinale TaxID=138064 RepID=A0ABR2XP31_9PEZI
MTATKVNFQAIDFDFNEKWTNRSDTWTSTPREGEKIIVVKTTPVLVINGMNDVGINWEDMTEVTKLIRWSGQARFKTQALSPRYLYDGSGIRIGGGNYKWHDRLAIVNVDKAGHMSPHDQAAATSFVMRMAEEKHTRSLVLLLKIVAILEAA